MLSLLAALGTIEFVTRKIRSNRDLYNIRHWFKGLLKALCSAAHASYDHDNLHVANAAIEGKQNE